VKGRLRVAVGESALAAEHARLLRTALRRGRERPERAPGETMGAGRAPRAIAIARATWLRRMAHEHQSAMVFARLLPQLACAEATLDVKTAVLRMAMDELRHAALCGDVALALGGRAEVEIDLATTPLPEHPGCTSRERALRNVLFVGCLSETVALALLSEERELAEEPLARRVAKQLAADEVLHAKLGWIHLATTWPLLDQAERSRTNAYLPAAFAYLEREMLAAMPLPDGALDERVRADLTALGVLASDEGRALFYKTVEEVVVPRLEDAGLPARAAWELRVVTASR
jgi:hypothetical protein